MEHPKAELSSASHSDETTTSTVPKTVSFLDISQSDLNIRFFFTMLRNYIASATLMGVGDIYMRTEALHLFDAIVVSEWINTLLGGSIMATGFVLCVINVYQSYLVLKRMGVNRMIGALVLTYLSIAGLIVIIGVERRVLTALQLVLK